MKPAAADEHAALDAARQHVRECMVPAVSGRKCVDGRYQPSQSTGMLARPGGDFGYVMALLALRRQHAIRLSPEQCVDAVYGVLVKGGGRFSMHTDTSVDPTSGPHRSIRGEAPPAIGCGHIVHAMNERTAVMYAVGPSDVARALRHARERVLYGAQFEIPRLSGNHAEQGLLVVDSTRTTVNPFNPDSANMFFVYDRTRDREFIERLVPMLYVHGITTGEFTSASEMQTSATFRLMASQKPIYAVDVDGPEPVVAHVGYVDSEGNQ